MAASDVDGYLAGLDPARREALEGLRRTILALVPEAEEVISYGTPAVKIGGKVVAGFAAAKGHLSYLPHSGSVLGTLAEEVAGYAVTKGTLHFGVDEPLPAALVDRLVTTRMQELGLR